MEEHKDGIKDLLEDGGIKLKIGAENDADAAALQVFLTAHGRHEQEGPDVLIVSTPLLKVTMGDQKIFGKGDLNLNFKTTFAPEPEVGRLRCIIAGELMEIFLEGFTPEKWRTFADRLIERNAALGFVIRKGKPEKIFCFPVPGGYVRPIFGLSKTKQDLPLLIEFHEPQTPLNWAVGLAMFSLTDANKVRFGDWQEASIRELEDRVFCLTDAPRHGQHREDILGEVVKLATTQNWYYTIETVQVGRAWTKRATIGVQTAVPELQLIFLDTETGNRVFPSDPAFRHLLVPLEVKGRRIKRPDGKKILAFPKGRWKLESIRWRWVQAFNDDLLLSPALIETGKRKGLPMKSTKGKTIRKGYLIKVADNVFNALAKLRAEGRGSLYACRLLIMLASNLNKTETGIQAERVFRMLGIPQDYYTRTHEKSEEVIARAVLRLKERDIRALLAGSDEYPRTDPNPDRRKGPYYRFKRSPEYTPRSGIVSKETALAIEAEYKEPEKKAEQLILPGMKPAQPIPSGPEIRAAREAAGVNIRDFARMVKGPAIGTWSHYETGKPIRVKSISPDVWERVRNFVAEHGKKGS
jgi:hypothetical protein